MFTVASNFRVEEFNSFEEARAFAVNEYNDIMAHSTPSDLRSRARDGEMLVIYPCSIEELDGMFEPPEPEESWNLF